MGPEPNKTWATDPKNLPPSLSTQHPEVATKGGKG